MALFSSRLQWLPGRRKRLEARFSNTISHEANQIVLQQSAQKSARNFSVHQFRFFNG